MAEAIRRYVDATVDQQRARVPLAPPPQPDVHARHGELLRAVAEEGDGLARMVGVVRLALALTSDILRPSADFKNTPVPMLGQHYLSRRELQGAFTCRVQEIATYSPDPSEAEPYPFQGADYGTGAPVATLELVRLTPDAKTKATLLGNSARLEIRLDGEEFRLTLPRLGEVYLISLPALTITDPLSKSAGIDFTGQVAVKCSGASSTVAFKPRSAVKGEIDVIRPSRGASQGCQPPLVSTKVCSIRGNWDGLVTCTPRGEVGDEFVLLDSNAYCPPAPGMGGVIKSVDLNNIGPMEMPRLWSAVHDAIIDVDGRKKYGGKAAGKLTRALSEGLGGLSLDNNIPRSTSLNAGEEKSKAALPPCIKEVRAQGLHLKYTLAYWICMPPEDEKREATTRPVDAGASTSGT